MPICRAHIFSLFLFIRLGAVHAGWLFFRAVRNTILIVEKPDNEVEIMENNGKVCQLICCLINEDLLSVEEELLIKDTIMERERKRGRCLAGVIADQIKRNVESGACNESVKGKLYPLYKKCFLDSEIGTMDASELSELKIREFIAEAGESFGLIDNEMLHFMGMLQSGLNRLEEEGFLEFMPDKKMYRHYIEGERGIIYIENPYSSAEVEYIKLWIDRHPDDIRGLALGYYFTTDISLEEIVCMEKVKQEENCEIATNIVKINKNVNIGREKANFVARALKICPKEERFVFMDKKNGRWEKLNEKGITLRLYHICQELGIPYHSIGKRETLVPKKTK